MQRKFISSSLLIATSLISGCTFSFRSAQEEYSGADAARIRIVDSGNTVIRAYTEVDNCYKKQTEQRLTSPIAIMGLPITGSKLVTGMTSSNDIHGTFVIEYSIRPNQKLTVTHYYQENHTYGSFNREVSEKLMPQPNNDYDIILSDHSITIKNLNPSKNKSDTWSGKICETGVFDW